MTNYSLPFDAEVHVYRPGEPGFELWLERPRPYLAVDTETTGLDWADQIRLVQFGDSREAWVLQADRDTDLIRHVLERRGLRFIGWNIAFDTSHLKRLTGVDILDRSSDTGVLAGIHDPRASYQGGVGRGLKEWAVEVVGEVASLPQRDLDAIFRLRCWGSTHGRRSDGWARVRLDEPAYIRYAGADPVLTFRVHQHLVDLVRPRADVVRREQQVARIGARIRDRGFLLDEGHTERLRLHHAGILASTTQALADLGIVSIGSTRQIAERLREEGLEDFIEYTDLGNPSLDKSALRRFGELGSEVALLALKAKAARKISRDYAEVYQAAAAFDGRVHPGLRTIGAKTRRMTCAAPNLQSTPKREGDGLLVRDCFTADPGELILTADYTLMELRYAAAITGDLRLAADLEAGVDFFVELAHSVWPGRGLAMRTKAKIMVYAIMYGAGDRTLADISGLSVPEAAALRRAFLGRYPVFTAAFYAAQARLRATGGVELPHSGWLPSSPDRPHVAMNLLVQGGCRDAFGERLVAMDAAGLTPMLRMPVHDEVVLSVPEGCLADVARTVESVMPITDTSVPIPVTVSVGQSWGAAYK